MSRNESPLWSTLQNLAFFNEEPLKAKRLKPSFLALSRAHWEISTLSGSFHDFVHCQWWDEEINVCSFTLGDIILIFFLFLFLIGPYSEWLLIPNHVNVILVQGFFLVSLHFQPFVAHDQTFLRFLADMTVQNELIFFIQWHNGSFYLHYRQCGFCVSWIFFTKVLAWHSTHTTILGCTSMFLQDFIQDKIFTSATLNHNILEILSWLLWIMEKRKVAIIWAEKCFWVFVITLPLWSSQ